MSSGAIISISAHGLLLLTYNFPRSFIISISGLIIVIIGTIIFCIGLANEKK